VLDAQCEDVKAKESFFSGFDVLDPQQPACRFVCHIYAIHV
jgi:hypothetical protein